MSGASGTNNFLHTHTSDSKHLRFLAEEKDNKQTSLNVGRQNPYKSNTRRTVA